MNKEALGLVEVYGYLGAVEAADVALKSANVKLIGCEFVTGGLVTIKIEGDVAAVQASIDAARVAVDRLGVIASTHVIPRPTEETWIMLTGKNIQSKKEELIVSQSPKAEIVNATENLLQVEIIEEEILNKDLQNKINELQDKTVVELRKLVRELKIASMTNKQIKFARKDTLLEEIRKFYERGDN